ncbi:hypothetical protein MKW98_011153 [Papaver atlanticum]|uniref:Uncharacterized protein n=1 Tax=Papaver atlanticum TaxID=357466 RepID=A0AAD4XYK1_9MAGN|nr:hypothetical protein MKW98_011153 [Papaver atlanticum]
MQGELLRANKWMLQPQEQKLIVDIKKRPKQGAFSRSAANQNWGPKTDMSKSAFRGARADVRVGLQEFFLINVAQ